MEDRISIVTPDHVELDFEPAGVGSRLLALIVDAILIVAAVVVIVIGAVLTGMGTARFAGPEGGLWVVAVFVLFIYAIIWGYLVFFEATRNGQTPGKKWVGIRVVQDNGLPIGLREAAMRNLVIAADVMPPPACIVGGLMILLSKRGKRLGDLLAGTMVVREETVAEAHPRSSRWETSWVAGAERGRTRRSIAIADTKIEAPQIQIIERFLSRCDSLRATQRQTLAWRIAFPFLKAMGEDPELLANRPDRYEVCERVLRAISARASEAPQTPGSAPSQDASDAKLRQWREFDKQIADLHKRGKNGLRRLSSDELSEIVESYRRLACDLARARTIGRDTLLVRRLNRVAIRAHNLLYGYRRTPKPGSEIYWGYRFPLAVRNHLQAVALSAALMFGPAVAAYVVVQLHPEIGYDLVPETFLNFEPAREETLHSMPSMMRPVVASAIISNNVQVTLLAYGLGLAAGIGTSFLLIFNGAQIGAIAGWMTLRGNSRALWGFIMPHGGIELLAIVLAGGAGFAMARAIIAPGQVRRGVALRRVAWDALIIEIGVMVMLACAGLIEGFISPSSIGFSARLAIFAVTLMFWIGYLSLAGRRLRS